MVTLMKNCKEIEEIYGQPNIKELGRMFCFCRQYHYIFIYKCWKNQHVLRKYLEISRITGYVIL